ncbi:hypothetical protein QBC39DRAFT_337604 [Podospora conica]|nr:hypothetical protein QBC39DRAFT_337604 [Schizothecium conicum]
MGMGEPSRAVRRCECVCCRPWSCSSIVRSAAAGRVDSPRGSWHACPGGLGQYYVHLAWISDEERLCALHALQSAECSTVNGPTALVLQPKGVISPVEQSADMYDTDTPRLAPSARALVFFFPVPPTARKTGSGADADRERGWRWTMDHGWSLERCAAVRMLHNKLHPTPHPPLTTRQILTETDILSIWDPLSRPILFFPPIPQFRTVNTAFAVRGIMPERAAR